LEKWTDAVKIENFKVITVHGDYHPGNLKFQLDKISAVLDFDWSHTDYRVFDIALAIVYFCTSWEAKNNGQIMLDKMNLFLNAYQKAATQSVPMGRLNADEISCLPEMILLANFFILNWTVDHFFTYNPNPHHYLRYLHPSVRVARWWESHRRELDGAIISRIVP
jgi:homoserine kinase type II